MPHTLNNPLGDEHNGNRETKESCSYGTLTNIRTVKKTHTSQQKLPLALCLMKHNLVLQELVFLTLRAE